MSPTSAIPARLGWLLALLLGLLAVIAAGCGGDRGPTLTVGDRAPDFTLPATDGSTVSLSDYLGKTSVLLYFSMGAG